MRHARPTDTPTDFRRIQAPTPIRSAPQLWKELRRYLLQNGEQKLWESNSSLGFEELCILSEAYAQGMCAPFYGILCQSELMTVLSLFACLAAQKPCILFPSPDRDRICRNLIDRLDPPVLLTDLGGELKQLYLESLNPTRSLRTAAVVWFSDTDAAHRKPISLSVAALVTRACRLEEFLCLSKRDTVALPAELSSSPLFFCLMLAAVRTGCALQLTPKDCRHPALNKIPDLQTFEKQLFSNKELAQMLLI